MTLTVQYMPVFAQELRMLTVTNWQPEQGALLPLTQCIMGQVLISL